MWLCRRRRLEYLQYYDMLVQFTMTMSGFVEVWYTLLLVCRRSSNYLMKRIFLGFFLKNFINRFGSEHIFELLVWSTTPDLTKRRFILWYFQHYNEHREKADHCVKSVQIRSFFWSVFSCTWTEYGEILPVSPYSVWMQEHTDQKKLCIWTLFTQWISGKLCSLGEKNIAIGSPGNWPMIAGDSWEYHESWQVLRQVLVISSHQDHVTN